MLHLCDWLVNMVVGRIVLILGLVWLSGNSLYMRGEGKGDLHMWEQRGLGSACASAQSDQSLLCSDQQEKALKQSLNGKHTLNLI